MDSVHPTQATKITYGCIRPGKEKEVSTTASRTRLNIIGAIQLEHLAKTITEQYQTINGDSIIDFMNKLREQYSANKKLHLIVDQAGYNKSQAAKNEAEKLNHLKAIQKKHTASVGRPTYQYFTKTNCISVLLYPIF